MTAKRTERINRLKGTLSLTCALILFAAVFSLTVRGIRNLSSEYYALLNLDLSADAQGSIGYDDMLYGSIRYGIEIDSRESGKSERLLDFTESALRSVDKRIITCIVIYTMLIVTVAAYWLYIRFGLSRRKHVFGILFAVLTVSAGLLAPVLITHAAFRLPFYFPAPEEVPVLAVSLLAVLGGSCFLGWMLSLLRFKRFLSFAAIPVVILLFMQGTVFESGLYCDPEVPSFNYIAEEIEPRIYEADFEGEVYYDEEKDVIVLNGSEYPPRLVQNPDYLTGPGRLSAVLFEMISPYSGNGMFLLHEAGDITAGAGALSLYALKAMILVVFPLCTAIRKKQGGGHVRLT